MSVVGPKNPNASLESLGIKNTKTQYWNLSAEELINETVNRGQGVLSDTGALAIDTGEFTGRSPKDKFIVKDENTKDSVDWGGFNNPVTPETFDNLYAQLVAYFEGKDVFVHFKDVNGGVNAIKDNDDVEFEITDGKKGPQAVNVTKV